MSAQAHSPETAMSSSTLLDFAYQYSNTPDSKLYHGGILGGKMLIV